jgi:hypothetical protein
VLVKALFSRIQKMPRHIRGARKRRSPKSRERAPIAGIPGSAKAKAELFQRLRRAFESTPEVSETPERTRERYIDAIDSVADYLACIGADAVWVERFDELSEALEDLVDGALPPVLRPAISKA